jgi:hypothetical protein
MEENDLKDLNSLRTFFERILNNMNSNKEKINNVRFLLEKSIILIYFNFLFFLFFNYDF